MRLPAATCGVRRHLHVERGARARYGFPSAAFSIGGRLLEIDFAAAERVTAAMNAARAAGVVAGRPVSPGELGAAALLHELAHALLAGFEWHATALASVETRLGLQALNGLLQATRERFPPPEEDSSLEDAVSSYDDAATLEELLLLGEASANRALDALAELFDLGDLPSDGRFDEALAQVHEVLRGVAVDQPGPPAPREGEERQPRPAHHERLDLLTLLRMPASRHPESLLDQLKTALDLWAPLLGERFVRLLRRALRGVDQLSEEQTFVAAPGTHAPVAFPAFGPGPEHLGEPAYSADSAWMSGVVMIAKNAFVWLEQLSRRHGRHIARLDQVPEDALRELAAQGFDTLWLVGIWQRSEASRAIKRARGQPFAEASAYAIFDYVIAPELGGEEALRGLSALAGRHGLRLASDMVPNHTGIDSRWVEEHPDWFLRLDRPPFASYRFEGPDLTAGRPVAVRIEDGYYDGSDAAVVFERRERASGEVSYVYHGNDGTAMPWNDTAQLDYLNPAVRAAVIETIVAVADRFKVIRFDAAMTLVRRHIRRLWHPPPGEGGAVPSRGRHALDEAAFDAAMPREFWREVVEAIAARAPDTLLVAEAFWLMESYFVRELGVHRVYNSAFMHLLAEERNADYQRLLRRTLDHGAKDLERFVNYLTTPDEESAAESFGRGDKYFGAATMLATLPGMPLFGHGQVEGLSEKYGMEFRAPRLTELPDERLVERHLRVIAPLLARRADFASAEGFRLLGLIGEDGTLVADVYAYVFARTAARTKAALVLFNNSPVAVSGRLSASPGAGEGSAAVDAVEVFGLPSERSSRAVHAVMRWSTESPPGWGRRLARADPSSDERPDGEGEAAVDISPLLDRSLVVELEPYQAVVLLDIAVAPVRPDRPTAPPPAAVGSPRARAADRSVVVQAHARRAASRRRSRSRHRR